MIPDQARALAWTRAEFTEEQIVIPFEGGRPHYLVLIDRDVLDDVLGTESLDPLALAHQNSLMVERTAQRIWHPMRLQDVPEAFTGASVYHLRLHREDFA